MTILSCQSPLNIFFNLTYPLAKFFNSKNLAQQMHDFLIFFSRIPINIQTKIKEGSATYITNLAGLFKGGENVNNILVFN